MNITPKQQDLENEIQRHKRLFITCPDTEAKRVHWYAMQAAKARRDPNMIRLMETDQRRASLRYTNKC